MGSSERPRLPRLRDRSAGDLKMGAQGADAWLPPGPSADTAGPQWETALGSPDIQPGLFLHYSLHRGIMMAHRDSTGDPGVHGSGQMTEKGVRARLVPGLRCLLALALAVSFASDGCHGHGPAQRATSGSSGWCLVPRPTPGDDGWPTLSPRPSLLLSATVTRRDRGPGRK